MSTFIISAAGLGTRLGLELPKCLVPLGDGCLIDHQLSLMPDGADVRIVVGYKEGMVVQHVRRHWRNVTFVRNPNYATTSNSHSLWLAARHLTGPYFSLDGDLVLDPASFSNFLQHCASTERNTIGICARGTEEAVGVALDADGRVSRFVRPHESELANCKHEWAGLAYLHNLAVQPNQRYVFEELSKALPLDAMVISCAEIDTAADLHAAQLRFPKPHMKFPEPT